jgi:predicted MPP superfamily phosphohydrolase
MSVRSSLESDIMEDTSEVLFTWLHLSDIHFGHGPVSHRWDQKLVLKALSDDLTRLSDRGIPKPDAILITGDIAFSGAKLEYDEAAIWIEQIINEFKLARSDVLIVPGNHDVSRELDRRDRNVARLVARLRAGEESLDEALANTEDRRLLENRLANYLDFAGHFLRTEDTESTNIGLYWHQQRTAALGLVIRFVGLNTSILSANDEDKAKLRVGKEQLAVGLSTLTARPGEANVILTHHPLNWLGDYQEVASWIRARADVHLCGHIHEGESEKLRKGGGIEIVSVVAGAVHGEARDVIGHGYSVASIVARVDGRLTLRIWPRSWSQPNKDFRVSIDQIPEGSVFVDHDLRCNLPTVAMEFAGTFSEEPEKTALPSEDSPQGGVNSIQESTSTNIPVSVSVFHEEYPPLVTAFVGRKHELKLLEETATVVAITGIGGQGKSALAASYLASSVNSGRYEFSDWRDCREEANKIYTQIVAIIERLTQGRVRGSHLSGADDESLVRSFRSSRANDCYLCL